MAAQQAINFPETAEFRDGVNCAAGPWVSEAEPMLPASQVLWASLALLVMGCAVLLAA